MYLLSLASWKAQSEYNIETKKVGESKRSCLSGVSGRVDKPISFLSLLQLHSCPMERHNRDLSFPRSSWEGQSSPRKSNTKMYPFQDGRFEKEGKQRGNRTKQTGFISETVEPPTGHQLPYFGVDPALASLLIESRDPLWLLSFSLVRRSPHSG